MSEIILFHYFLLGFWLSSNPQLPGNSQVGLAYYKEGYSTSPLSLTSLTSLLSFSHSQPLSYPLLGSTPPTHVVMAGFCFSTLFFSLPFSASTTILTPLPMP